MDFETMGRGLVGKAADFFLTALYYAVVWSAGMACIYKTLGF